MEARKQLKRRLAQYWKLEAGAALVLPPLLVYFARPDSTLEWAALLGAALPTFLLLVLGAYYWFASLRRICGDAGEMARAIALADRSQLPLLLLTALAFAGAAALLASEGMRAPGVMAAILASLAALEYVNYFHVQLQNFDHGPDLKRLLGGRGLRAAHLGRDLAEYRRQRQARS